MKAVDDVFPKCTTLLCQYHILMNVKTNFLKKAKLGKKVRSCEVWPNVNAAWENIVDSTSEEEYNSSVNTFKERYGYWSEFIEYVESTILGPIKEKFVRV
jgi:Zn-finger protein